MCSKSSLINVSLLCRYMKKKKVESCVTYGGQNYVRKFGRPMHRGKENSRAGWVWWLNLSGSAWEQVMVSWEYGNELSVDIYSGLFLTSSGTIGFSRITPIHWAYWIYSYLLTQGHTKLRKLKNTVKYKLFSQLYFLNFATKQYIILCVLSYIYRARNCHNAGEVAFEIFTKATIFFLLKYRVFHNFLRDYKYL